MEIEVIGGDEEPEEMKRLVILWQQSKILSSIYEGIRQANRQDERITAILNYYNPVGSTSHVFGATTKPVWPTEKSHVNYVVADTQSWEQIAAKTLEGPLCGQTLDVKRQTLESACGRGKGGRKRPRVAAHVLESAIFASYHLSKRGRRNR